jgi:ribosome maturation factor RimP
MNTESQSHLEPIFSLVEPLVEAAGHKLYDIQQNGGTLAVLVDSDDGLGIDDLSGLSRSVSALLDEHDPIPGRYTLELSTPGVERRLRQEKHFAGAVGETVNIRTNPGPEGRRRIVGTLLHIKDGTLTIDSFDLGATTVHLQEVEKARTVFEWGPSPKPGSSGKKNGSNNNHKGGSQG